MTTVVFVPGAGQPDVSIDFETAGPLALAQQIAAALAGDGDAPALDVNAGESVTTGDAVVLITSTSPDTVVGSASQGVAGGDAGLTYTNNGSGSVAVALDGGTNDLTFGAGITAHVAIGAGNDTITAAGTGDQISLGNANATVAESGSGALITAGAGTATVNDTGTGDTVIGGTGPITVTGGRGGYYNLAADSSVSFTGASGGSETILGGASDTVHVAGSALLYYAAAGATVELSTSGGESPTVVGAAGTNLSLNGPGDYVVSAGAGDFINAAASTGANSFFAEQGGNNVIIDGSGATSVQVEGGDTTLAGGSGATLLDYTATATPSQLVFTNFVPGNDFLELFGSSSVQSMLANQTQDAYGDAVLTLAPGTTVTFPGVAQIEASDIIGGGVACFAAGTRISAAAGEVAVEDLKIGDLVRTHAGSLRPIRWIGRRAYSGRFCAGTQIRPILIRAGALAQDVPRRDLLVSPNHALYLDHVLVPAAALVNGATIVQVAHVDSIEYFHVELQSHDIILAEGAPAETFLDDDSRLMFHNAAQYAILYPDAPQHQPCYCAPRVEDGIELQRIRQRLRA